MVTDEQAIPAPDTDRRSRIERLLKAGTSWPVTGAETAEANALALLEIADAIDNLAAAVERAGWAKK